MSRTGLQLLRPEVLDFSPYSPGLGIDEIKTRYNLENVIKLASNENPLGASPVVREEIERYAGHAFRYPSSGNLELRQALASMHRSVPERIICGNGSDEIIDLLIRILCVPGQNNIAAFRPCFSIYKLQSRLCGVDFRQTPLNPDFSFNFQGLLELVDEQTRIVFVTNPDNPSGYAASWPEIENLACSLPQSCILIIDEAYLDFAEPAQSFDSIPLALASQNIAVMRTFSKMYALAGLRLGYAVLPDFLADYLLRVRLPFSVNLLAEKAGLAALQDQTFRQTTRELILSARQEVTAGLQDLGCQVYPSQANFLMFKPPLDPDLVFNQLLSQGIIIRPLKSYGLAELLRVSLGTSRENQLFLEALAKILHEN
ncbi:MAG: histidinol-phosphate transaminase [Desulfonatronovibrionaceae bacterium]